MYADATQRAFSPHDQHSHQLPPHQQQQQRNPGQLQYYPDYCTNIQQTQPQITSNPLQSHVGGLQFHQQQAGQMQSYNGYNPNDAGSMPPPSSLGGMNINTIATRTNQQYQGHMRSNNQQVPPSSPGYVQSPTNFNIPTPLGQSGQQFYGQPMLSLTNPPSSQPQMVVGSPQVGNNPLQQPQKQIMTGQGEISKIDAARIDLLLELNRVLIQEVVQLQSNGRAGSAVKQGQDAQTGQQSPTVSDTKDSIDGDGEKKVEESVKKGPPPSREYVECMLRLRANFAYLTTLASRNKQQAVVERQMIMEPLSINIEGNTISEDSMRNIRDLYRRLKELFPNAGQQQINQGQTQQQQQQGLTPQQQALNMQQQIFQHQQQMAAQAGNIPNMSPSSMGQGQAMNPQLMQQQMMARARAMADMQHQQSGMNQGM